MYFPLPSLYFDAVRSPDKMLVHPSIHEPVAVRGDVFIFARRRRRHRFQTEPQKIHADAKIIQSEDPGSEEGAESQGEHVVIRSSQIILG